MLRPEELFLSAPITGPHVENRLGQFLVGTIYGPNWVAKATLARDYGSVMGYRWGAVTRLAQHPADPQ